MDESHLEVICCSELLYAQFSTPLLYLLDGYSLAYLCSCYTVGLPSHRWGQGKFPLPLQPSLGLSARSFDMPCCDLVVV